MYRLEVKGTITGAPPGQFDELRNADIASIREFVQKHAHMLTGRVMDLGCGRPGTCREPEPYRSLLSCSEYIGVDKGDDWPDGKVSGILCTQALQYFSDPMVSLQDVFDKIEPSGVLVMTYGTNWPEVEETDLWRFPKAGMEIMLADAGFIIEAHERRVELVVGPNVFATGYGVVARKRA